MPRLEPGQPGVRAIVAMIPSMGEHLDPEVAPSPQPRTKSRGRAERVAPPMIGHHQHRDAILGQPAGEQRVQRVHLRLEARSDIVNRDKQPSRKRIRYFVRA